MFKGFIHLFLFSSPILAESALSMVTNNTIIQAAVRPNRIVPHPRLVCEVTA